MSIIAISRCSYTHGKDIAEAVATKLRYACISREDLLDASQEFNMPGIKLIKEIPNNLDQTSSWNDRYISYIRSSLLRHLKKDNIVYHGFCGHVFFKDIDHVLKVQITADLLDRVNLVMERDGVSRNEALAFIKTMDAARKKWCQNLYKKDISNAEQYDIAINISKFSYRKAVNIICKAVQLKRFQTTLESQKAMDELLFKAEIEAGVFSDNDIDRLSLMACLMGV
jgi:cytidylate kinase